MNRTITFNVRSILVSMFFVLGFGVLFAQERTCGVDAYMQEMMADPEFAREHQLNQQKFQEEYARILERGGVSERGSGTIVIPVAVHFPGGNEANRACLEALAQNQVDILNADYAALNSDIGLWDAASAFYPNTNLGATNFYFCLATQNHPANTDADLVEGGPAVTIGWNFGNGGDADSRWSGYMNFVVKSISGGILGYSPLGGSIAAGRAVVMNTFAFGSGSGCAGYTPGAPYNLGRTVTHELGHFYNLNHTFANDNGCGPDDDGIEDTPKVGYATYGCPANGSVDGCVAGEKALTMNYMDYVNDACMYMFTQGQVAVMQAYMNVLQAQFKPNVTECTLAPDFMMATADSPLNACPSVGTAVFNFNYVPQFGFSESTTFSVSGVPTGATATLNPTVMSEAGSFTLTINNLGDVPVGEYDITVTGTSASITHQKVVTLNVTNIPCVSVANTSYQTSTTGVIFNTISNLNTGKPSGYSDYTAISTDVNREESYDLTVKVNTDGNYLTRTRVWIDWNQNCSFDDPGELYELGTAQNQTNGNTSNSPLSITIPSDAVLGSTIMRVSTKYSSNPTACENGADAEVEDYTINVLQSLSVAEHALDGFSIYPNPNNGEFTLSLQSVSNNNLDVTVYDIRGRKVYGSVFEGNTSNFTETIRLNNVQSGMYLLKVVDGNRQVIKKIVVE
ncbi:MAG TPA: GEVED domain-containing protein [Aquaticitalea sp.]|nr:GEVED domain-containing protein [Aquaticitalea sp.]HNU59199.1 GEVED domain-containing protein [Aquaticitalea sp.]